MRYQVIFSTFSFRRLIKLAVIGSFAGMGPVNAQGLVDEFHLLQPTEITYPNYGVEIGAGWDQFLGRKTGSTCVEFSEEPLPKTTYEQDVRVVNNSFELANSQYAKLSGSVNWGFISAGVSAEVDRQETLHQDAVTIVSTIVVEAGSTQAVNIRTLSPNEDRRLNSFELSSINRGDVLKFSSEVLAVLSKENDSLTAAQKRAWFRQTCGTGYVATIRRGARVSILASRVVNSSSERESLDARARASGWGMSFRGHVKSKLEASSEDSEITLKVRQEGGTSLVAVSLDESPAQIAGKLDGAGIYANPTSFGAVVMPYSMVSGSDIDLVAASFPMKEYSTLYYFMSDTLKGFSDAAEYLYSTRYNDPTEALTPFSTLSLTVAGGHDSVIQRRAILRQSIGALVSAIEVCYYKNARVGLDVSRAEQACSIEDSLVAAREEYLPRNEPLKKEALDQVDDLEKFIEFLQSYTGPVYVNDQDLSGLSFLLPKEGQETIPRWNGSVLAAANVQSWSASNSGPEFPVRALVQYLYENVSSLPLSPEDLSIESASKSLGIDAWKLWSSTENQEQLLGYIRSRIFYLRLHPLREQLCQISVHPDYCWFDEQLMGVIPAGDMGITADIFPTEAVKVIPPLKDVVPPARVFETCGGLGYGQSGPNANRNVYYHCP